MTTLLRRPFRESKNPELSLFRFAPSLLSSHLFLPSELLDALYEGPAPSRVSRTPSVILICRGKPDESSVFDSRPWVEFGRQLRIDGVSDGDCICIASCLWHRRQSLPILASFSTREVNLSNNMASYEKNLSESVVDLADRMAALSSNMVDDVLPQCQFSPFEFI